MTSLPTASSERRHAVVMGASMAGLLAGRILLNHFDRVTIVERDRLLEDSEPRPGVPQGTHVHVLLARGQQILEQLFPGFIAELIDAGAPKVNWTAECPVYSIYGWHPRFVSDLVTYTRQTQFSFSVSHALYLRSESLSIPPNSSVRVTFWEVISQSSKRLRSHLPHSTNKGL
jgi:hypothetical protein